MSRRLHRIRRRHSLLMGSGLVAGLAVSPVSAEPLEGGEPQPDKSGYWLFNPVPDSQLRGFAPDRPAKTTGPTTVDAGHVQYEMDFVSFNHQVSGGANTRSWVAPNPTLKVGLTNSLDLQVSMAPFAGVSVIDQLAGTSSRVDGHGDLVVKAKWNWWGNDGGKTAFAIMPYVKAPTATSGLGNGATEGGGLAALQISLPRNWSLVANTQVDALKDSADGGYHPRFVNAVTLSMPVVDDVTFNAELWSSVDRDRAGTVVQYTFDTALAWTVRPNIQLDIGANFGLNDAAPRVEFYGGIAQRF